LIKDYFDCEKNGTINLMHDSEIQMYLVKSKKNQNYD
jgi:hypothetical protein